MLQRRREILATAGREVVKDHHVVAPRQQGVDEVGADEARASCDQGQHGGAIYRCGLR